MTSNSGMGCHEPTSSVHDISAINENLSMFEPMGPTVIPSQLLIQHRLGFSTVRLNEMQRSNRIEAETLALYKQLKYNNVNTFYRFIAFILCLLVPSVFCHTFGLGTTEWFVMQYQVHHRSLGLFFACREGLAGICIELATSNYPRIIRDRLTHNVVCEVSASFVQRYIGAMWFLGIVQFIFSIMALIIILRMTCRPTRSRISLVALCFLAASIPCGITNCVLFYFYTRCDREECNALHYSAPDCRVHYSWGYNLYIAAICLDFCACITTLCLYSYPHSIYNYAARLLAERRAQNREEEGIRDSVCAENSMIPPPPAAATPAAAAAAVPPTFETPHHHHSRTFTNNNNNDIHDNNDSSSRRNPAFHRLLRMVRGDMEGPAYLTAVELGVEIEGASDWLYDDKSDLFYSPTLNMFWDPLTHDYYSCALRVWQVTVEGLPGLRSARGGANMGRRW